VKCTLDERPGIFIRDKPILSDEKFVIKLKIHGDPIQLQLQLPQLLLLPPPLLLLLLLLIIIQIFIIYVPSQQGNYKANYRHRTV
jgi:hypothetical protein